MDFHAFYKVLNNVITKNDKVIEDIEIGVDTYNQYLMNRYLSFYDPVLLDLIDQSLNKQFFIPNGDDLFASYKFTKSVIPKMPSKKIDYHKKASTNKIQNLSISDEDIFLLAQKKEMSVRELKELLKFV